MKSNPIPSSSYTLLQYDKECLCETYMKLRRIIGGWIEWGKRCTLGVTRWQPLLWGGRVMVFWAHLGAAAAMEFGSFAVLGVRLVYSDLTRTGAEAGFAAKNTEEVCMGSKPAQFQLSPRKFQMWCAPIRIIRRQSDTFAPPLPHIIVRVSAWFATTDVGLASCRGFKPCMFFSHKSC
jgi:hypothetical protein